ncbi:hypothetical protein CVT24_004685 [Panaeolus cyanescens]|uniref:DH domain-containing protein n=1 Tax=Panaeolus cyanescens TaxID=181874 RepID=A0A409W1B5_9AGAR|nr:hypothetical protein CVT24_004685 [Panaeolus cyanescens]
MASYYTLSAESSPSRSTAYPISTSRSHLSPSPAPPSSWSRMGSAVSLNPPSSQEPSPAPSRNTSSSSLSRWMFWRGNTSSWKGKGRESDEEEDPTIWQSHSPVRANNLSEVSEAQQASYCYLFTLFFRVATLASATFSYHIFIFDFWGESVWGSDSPHVEPHPIRLSKQCPSSGGQTSCTNYDKAQVPPLISQQASTSKLPLEINLTNETQHLTTRPRSTHDSKAPKTHSKHHRVDGSISSVHTLARALGHNRNASWGDAAAVLLFGTAAEAIADRERERANLFVMLDEQVFGGSAEGMETREEDGVEKMSLKSTPSQRRRAKFVLGGGESDLDLSEAPQRNAKTEKPVIPRPRLARRDAFADVESEAEDIVTPSAVAEKGSIVHRYRSVAEAIVDESLMDEELMRVVERLRKERLARSGPSARSRSPPAASALGSQSTTPVSSGASSPEEEWEAIDDLRREIWEGVPIVGSHDIDDTLDVPSRWGFAPLQDSPREQDFANEVDTAFNFTKDSNAQSKSSQPASISRAPSSASHSSSTSSPNPSPTYQTALRALLITREILLTETNYLTSLTQLLTSKTRTPPPALMLHYASDLLQVSKKLAEEMRGDVSVKGIARAFLKCEVEVERAFRRWCGVVGGWFVEGREFEESSSIAEEVSVGHSMRARRSGRRMSMKQASLVEGEVLESANTVEDVAEDGVIGAPNVSPLKRNVSTWRRSLPSMVGLGHESSHGIYSAAWRKHERERSDAEEKEVREREKERKKRPAVRDLAILPTQRVMRYVLLYRDLLNCTPRNSSSRIYVERALEAACRIAERCDRAQGNAAFVSSSSSSSSASTSRSNSNGSSSSAISSSVTSISTRSTTSPSSARAKMGRFGSKRASLMISPISASPSSSSFSSTRSASSTLLDKKNRASHPPFSHVSDAKHGTHSRLPGVMPFTPLPPVRSGPGSVITKTMSTSASNS